MSITIVSDQFTEASTIALTSHVPSTAGAGYTTIDSTGTSVLNNDAADVVIISLTATAAGHFVASAPDPSGAEYTVSFTVPVGDTGSATRPLRLIARWTDVSNHYHFRLLPDAHASPSQRLVKVVAGTLTELANADNPTVGGDVFQLIITDALKTVTQNGVVVLSSTDNSITAAGKAGFGMGKLTAGDTSGNVNTGSWQIDNYSVTMPGMFPPFPPAMGTYARM